MRSAYIATPTAGCRRYILLGTSKIPNGYWVFLLKGTVNIDIKDAALKNRK